MSDKADNDLPNQPSDCDIQKEAQDAIANDDWARLEEYLFAREYLCPSWVLYIAIQEACVIAKPNHSGRLEQIVRRASTEMTDCPDLVETAIKDVEDFFRKTGDVEGTKRLVLLRTTVFAIRMLNADG